MWTNIRKSLQSQEKAISSMKTLKEVKAIVLELKNYLVANLLCFIFSVCCCFLHLYRRLCWPFPCSHLPYCRYNAGNDLAHLSCLHLFNIIKDCWLLLVSSDISCDLNESSNVRLCEFF